MYLHTSYDLVSYIAEGKRNKYNRSTIDNVIRIGDSLFSIGTMFDKYYNFIVNEATTVTLNDKEAISYKYNPKKLSKDLYDTEELWHLILSLNNIASEQEFVDLVKIKILKPSSLSILDDILMLESKHVSFNIHELSY